MNMSHIVTHLTFGTMVSERLWTDMKRLLPYLGQSYDRLNGKSFINERQLDANVTVSSTNFHVKYFPTRGFSYDICWQYRSNTTCK